MLPISSGCYSESIGRARFGSTGDNNRLSRHAPWNLNRPVRATSEFFFHGALSPALLEGRTIKRVRFTKSK